MRPAVVAQGLTVRYPSGVVIGPVSLDLGPGVWQLTGPNGAGKTTLLRCLAGACRWTEGAVRVCGQDPIAHAPARARVGYLPAEADLPDALRVSELWRMAAALRGRPDWDGRGLQVELDLPARLRYGHASSGQRARAGLLFALAGDPDVLLLDEPWSHLDAQGGRWLADWIDAHARDRVILLSSHSPPPVTLSGIIPVLRG